MTAEERRTSTGTGSRDLPALVLIDDDPLIAESLAFVLRDDYAVSVAASRVEARALLQGLPTPPALALVDLGLPPTPHSPEEGFALVGELLAFNPRMKILILSGQSDRRNIQHALTLGAVDFVPKPTDVPLLRARLAHQLMLLDAERVEAEQPLETCGLLGSSPAMATLRAQAGQFADTPFPVLIEGESGSGKELVAQCLHSRSQRAAEPFLSLNCAAIAADLIEAQLFGHARGPSPAPRPPARASSRRLAPARCSWTRSGSSRSSCSRSCCGCSRTASTTGSARPARGGPRPG
jgi:DNA-binding NtrC family response regulator